MAGAGAARARGLGRRAGSRPAGWRSCAWTPRRSAWTLPCAPVSTARCWPRRRHGRPRRRCASGGGRCWRWPSTRPAGRATRCAPCTRPARCSSTELGVDPGPDLVALEQAILRQDPSLVAAAALPEPGADLPVPGSGALRRRRQRGLLRARARDRGVPGSAGRGRRARGGRTLGQREVVAGAGRGGGRAATRRPSGRGDHPGCPPDGRAHRAAALGSGAGPGGRPVRGGGHAVRRPGRRKPRSSPPSPPTPNVARWSSPCAPTGSASCRPTRTSPVSSSPGCTC